MVKRLVPLSLLCLLSQLLSVRDTCTHYGMIGTPVAALGEILTILTYHLIRDSSAKLTLSAGVDRCDVLGISGGTDGR